MGGGTLMGLSKRLINMENVDNIIECAKEGDLTKIDLRLKDMSRKGNHPRHARLFHRRELW